MQNHAIPRPEYPRPQFVRDSWVNLNGAWEFAIDYGNRLIMMHEGRIIYEVAGEEKQKLEVSDLLEKFAQASDGKFANDRMLLSK